MVSSKHLVRKETKMALSCFVEKDRTSSVSNMNHCKIYNELKNKIERNKVFKDSKRDFFSGSSKLCKWSEKNG